MDRKYHVHSSFLTLQGEGYHAGRKAVFVRFSGCNVWSGLDKDRERDADHNSGCARICDTKFVGKDETNGGGSYTAEELRAQIVRLGGGEHTMTHCMVVFTGGEPSLQLDEDLLAVFGGHFYLAVETNGTRRIPDRIDWITLSPKPPMPIVQERVDEVKVLSCFDPRLFENVCIRRYFQPVDYHDEEQNKREVEKCVNFVMQHPLWRLSLQTHKTTGIQ